MNVSVVADPYCSKSSDRETVDDRQALHAGFNLARASQLTMLRLQLALHGSNVPAAMQALDLLLDIDSEMESIEATLVDDPRHGADDAALSGSIKFQKSAIAVEKHVLTGFDHRNQARSISVSEPCHQVSDVGHAQPMSSGEEAEASQRVEGKRWLWVLTLALIITVVGIGLLLLSVSVALFARTTF